MFLGGGTPSLFSAEAIDRLLAGVRARLPLSPDAEITLEANPGHVRARELRRIPRGRREPAVDRRAELRRRDICRRSAACTTPDEARRGGRGGASSIFDNVNLDLMYGLPGQTLADDALADVEEALAFGTPHLSCYQLTLEPNTLFHRYPPPLPDDDDIARTCRRWSKRGSRRAGYRPLRSVRLRAARARCAAQPQLLALRRLPRHRRRRARQDVVRRPHRARGALEAAEAVSRAAAQAASRCRSARGDARRLGFEFMLNALRLTEAYRATLVRRAHRLPARIGRARDRSPRPRAACSIPIPAMLRATPLGRRFLNDLVALFLRDRAREESRDRVAARTGRRPRAGACARAVIAGALADDAARAHRRDGRRLQAWAHLDARACARRAAHSTRCRARRAAPRTACRSA